MKLIIRNKLLAISCVLSFTGLALSQSNYNSRKIEAIKFANAPVIDGVLSDEVWTTAPVASPFIDPFSGKPTPEQTSAKIGYDDEAIYVAFECFDSQPDGIVGREIRPGTEFQGEDFIVFRIDAFRTQTWEGVNRFLVNSLGTQSDNIAGGRAAKREWRGDWQSITKRSDKGWTAELRIPWKVINFPSDGKRDMTVNFVRNHERTKIRSLWSDQSANDRPELDGIWTGVEPPASKTKPAIQLLPYGLMEYDRTRSRFRGDMGLDIRYPFTEQLTGVASINPDFRNVEQAVESAAFTRNERFLGDARPFFAEGSSLFDLTTQYGIGRMFYSRRIRDFEVGGKAYGRLSSNLNFGALATAGNHGETNAVLNLVRDFGAKGKASIFGTVRDGNGIRNRVYGGTFEHRLGIWSVSGEGVRSESRTDKSAASTLELFYEVPKFFVTARYLDIEPDFDPALGLIGFTDKRGGYIYSEHAVEYRRSPIRRFGLEGEVYGFDTYDGSELERGASISSFILLRNDQRWSVSTFGGTFENTRDNGVSLGYVNGYTNRFRRFGGQLQYGERSSDPYFSASVDGSFRVLKKLDVGVSLFHQRLNGIEEQVILTAGWEIDPARSISGRLVKTGSNVNWYLAYRSSGFLGKELFVILGDPNADKFRARVSVKLVWPISFGG